MILVLYWFVLFLIVLLWRWYFFRYEYFGVFFYYGKFLVKDDFVVGIFGNILYGVYMYLKIISIYIFKLLVVLVFKSCFLY